VDPEEVVENAALHLALRRSIPAPEEAVAVGAAVRAVLPSAVGPAALWAAAADQKSSSSSADEPAAGVAQRPLEEAVVSSSPGEAVVPRPAGSPRAAGPRSSSVRYGLKVKQAARSQRD
jgi:hypothetical protein